MAYTNNMREYKRRSIYLMILLAWLVAIGGVIWGIIQFAGGDPVRGIIGLAIFPVSLAIGTWVANKLARTLT